jgi:hypothetical protein
MFCCAYFLGGAHGRPSLGRTHTQVSLSGSPQAARSLWLSRPPAAARARPVSSARRARPGPLACISSTPSAVSGATHSRTHLHPRARGGAPPLHPGAAHAPQQPPPPVRTRANAPGVGGGLQAEATFCQACSEQPNPALILPSQHATPRRPLAGTIATGRGWARPGCRGQHAPAAARTAVARVRCAALPPVPPSESATAGHGPRARRLMSCSRPSPP